MSFTCTVNKNGKWGEERLFESRSAAMSFIRRNGEKLCTKAMLRDDNSEFGRCEMFTHNDGKWRLSTVIPTMVSGRSLYGRLAEAVDLTKTLPEVKKYLNEVYRTNMANDYKGAHRLDESPEVGLFWIDVDTARVYGDGVGIRDADTLGVGTASEFCIHPSCHYNLWSKVKDLNDKWKDKHYEDVARGRVVFVKEPENRRFEVYVSPLAEGDRFEAAIRSFFSLPYNTVFHYDDEHYVPTDYN
jgi:hypothetical protein